MPFRPAEQASLGSCLLSQEALNVTFEYLEAEDFYKNSHKTLFHNIIEMVQENNKVDLVTFTERLQAKDLLESVGGIQYLTHLVNSVPTVVNIEHYNSIVKKYSHQRKIQYILSDLKASKISIEEALEQIANIPVIEVKEESLKTLLKNTILVSAKGVAHKYKIPSLNYYLGGADKGELITIGAFTSQGKTSLAIQLAIDFIFVDDQKKVLYLTSEMTPEETSRRILGNLLPKNIMELRKGIFKPKEMEALESIADIVGEHWHLNIKKIFNTVDIKRHIRKYKPEIVFIDYLQNLGRKGARSDYERVSDNIRDIQNLTLDLELTTYTLSQLSRDKTSIRAPKITDLRSSGRIEECSNVVLLLYWENRLKLKNMMRKGGEPPEKLEVQIAKNRDGSIGGLNLNLEPEYSRIREPEYVRGDIYDA